MIANREAEDRANREAVREQNSRLPGYNEQGQSPLVQRAMARRREQREAMEDRQDKAADMKFAAAAARRYGMFPDQDSAMQAAMFQGMQYNPVAAMQAFGTGTQKLGENQSRIDVAKIGAESNLDIAKENSRAALGVADSNNKAKIDSANIDAAAQRYAADINSKYQQGLLSQGEAQIRLQQLNIERQKAKDAAELQGQADERQVKYLEALGRLQREQQALTPQGRADMIRREGAKEGLPFGETEIAARKASGEIPSIPDNVRPIEDSGELVGYYQRYKDAVAIQETQKSSDSS